MPAASRSLERHALLAYFVLAYALSWAQWVPLLLTGRIVDRGPDPTHFPGLFGPCLAAFAVTALTEGRAAVRDLLRRVFLWRVAPMWYVAALSPLAFGGIALVSLGLLGKPLPDPADFGRMGGIADMPPWLLFLALIPLNGFSEEVGWRGFALPRLQRGRSALAASVLLAVPWALWHLPTFRVLASYRGLEPPMYLGFLLGLVCGSIVLAWIYNGSGGSLLLVALYHGALNLMTATLAARDSLAAVVSTCVMLNAGVLVAFEWAARRRHGHRPMEYVSAG